MPFFSIIIPLYNKVITNTLESVLSQTFLDFEIIIVNDGSTDSSLSVINGFDDERIKIISIKNAGVANARNIGMQNSISKHICFLDADDYWYTNHLQTFYDAIAQFPKANWYVNAYELEHNDNLRIPSQTPLTSETKGQISLVKNYFSCSMIDALAWTSTVCMKKVFFLKN